MTDKTTKLLLLAIALGLLANMLVAIFRPVPVKAASTLTCKGEIKANAWGGTTASIGGYEVDVKCD
ncbi:MAG: hypothetical protein LAO55_15260 [Acidobacteriia bacterium]|nr:hypothetical protein [Terriglobia bacterium]